MFECRVTEDSGLKWIHIKGRIDGLTAPELQGQMSQLVLGGQRTLVADLEEVHYMSSAGLRVFLEVHKQLKKVGGEIILFQATGQVSEVLQMSGFSQIFRMASSRSEVESITQAERHSAPVESREVDGIALQWIEKKAGSGPLVAIGSQEPLALAHYTEKEVVGVKPKDFLFGAGIATVGAYYKEYKHLFGESVIINRNIFFYPAVKHPVVDFMLCADGESTVEYRFLHGFGFNGSYRYIVSFGGTTQYVELSHLVNALFRIFPANILGIVLLAEIRGLWGIHLKKAPIIENAPSNGKEIFDVLNFSEWMNFPIEGTDTNHIVAGAGIAIRNNALEKPQVQRLVPEGNNFHLHAAVFSKGPLAKRMEQFDGELRRVWTELEVSRVCHLLGQTLLSNGMMGIIELNT